MTLDNKVFFEDIDYTRALGDRHPEHRHYSEDHIVHEFLKHVRDTGGTHSLGAKLLLEMLDDDVRRWYA